MWVCIEKVNCWMSASKIILIRPKHKWCGSFRESNHNSRFQRFLHPDDTSSHEVMMITLSVTDTRSWSTVICRSRHTFLRSVGLVTIYYGNFVRFLIYCRRMHLFHRTWTIAIRHCTWTTLEYCINLKMRLHVFSREHWDAITSRQWYKSCVFDRDINSSLVFKLLSVF